MSIKTRIKKLQEKLNINSAMCNCAKDLVIKVKPYDGIAEDPQTICDDCGKPIERLNFTFNINSPFETQVILPSLPNE